MDIYVYVVTDPRTREDLYQRILEAKQRRGVATITLHPVDNIEPSEDITVEFATRQMDQPSFGEETVRGEFVHDGQAYLINLIIPFWDGEEIVARIALAPTGNPTEKGSGQP